ncbi:hypothetical protein [Cohnella sp. JJ-181]|uniref:hypothetical protein n=1 Tax=Cohnella rhizoplanae TaxID=2974897 RepID=UPI0022FFB331|nr:hypothetical protein [Cohnella sp. JJ-181]CAI6069137.1 hypothetical protein COHCIP112018_02208 [Cohnella sp. JJ-181]
MAGKKHSDEAIAAYGKEELIAYAQELFGVKPEVAQGALHGANVDAGLTIESANALVQNFMNRKVN